MNKKDAMSAEARKIVPMVVDGELFLNLLKALEAVLQGKPGVILWAVGEGKTQRMAIEVPYSVSQIRLVSQAARSLDGYDYLDLQVEAPESWNGALCTIQQDDNHQQDDNQDDNSVPRD